MNKKKLLSVIILLSFITSFLPFKSAMAGEGGWLARTPKGIFSFTNTYYTEISYRGGSSLIGDNFVFGGYMKDGDGINTSRDSDQNAKFVFFHGPVWNGDTFDVLKGEPVVLLMDYENYKSNLFKPGSEFTARFLVPSASLNPKCMTNAENCAYSIIKISQPVINQTSEKFSWIYNKNSVPPSAFIQSSNGDVYKEDVSSAGYIFKRDDRRQIKLSSPLLLAKNPAFPSNGELQGKTLANFVTFSLIQISLPGAGPSRTGETINGVIMFRDGTEDKVLNNLGGLNQIDISLIDEKTKQTIDTQKLTGSGGYTFTKVPCPGTYKLEIKEQKADKSFTDWLSKTDTFMGLLTGDKDVYISGSKVFIKDNQCQFVMSDGNLFVNFRVEGGVDDLMQKNIQRALAAVVDGIGKAVGVVAGWVDDVLAEGNDLNNPGLTSVWEDVRNIAISLLTLGILIIAFANVLNIQLDRYGLAAMLPKLVTGIVLTYFSYLIAQFLLEIATAFQAFLTDRSQMGRLGDIEFIKAFEKGGFVDTTRGTGLLILFLIILVALFAVLIWLWLLLSIRIVVIYFLVALAPLAFMMSIMPFTESLYKQWWQRFTSWTFMGPAVAFMLWLVGEFLAVGFGTSFKFNSISSNSNSWVFLGMAIAALFLAGSIPLIMGKDIYSAIQKHGQKLGPVKWAQAWKKQSDKERDARRIRSVNRWRNRAGRIPGARGLAGYKKGFLNKQENYQRMIDAGMEDYKPASRDEVWRDMGKGGLKGDIAAMYAAKNKMMPTIDEANPENQAKTEAAARAADRIIKSGRLPGMFGEVIKNQPEFFAQAVLASGNTVKIQEEADKLSNFNISEMKQVQWRLAGKSEKTMKTLATQVQSLERMLQTSNMSTKIAAANAFAEGNALEHLPEHIKTELQGLVGQGPEHFVPANVKKKASAPATGAGASQTPPESNSGTGYQDGNF